jgi:hypothetical protein
MIKGDALFLFNELADGRISLVFSVMSGIITGPHFRKYFNSPGSLQVGTMVAVLEIGAFSTLSAIRLPSRTCYLIHPTSNVHRRRTNW